MRKYITILAVLITINSSLWGESFRGVIPVGFTSQYDIYQSAWIITGTTCYGKITFTAPEETRRIELSENEEYFFLTSGTDSIGLLSIYSSKNGKQIYRYWYSGKEPQWEDNTLKFEKVEWSGNGYTVRRNEIFKNGLLIDGTQFIGPYHGINDKQVDPFCINYSFKMYREISNCEKYVFDNLALLKKRYPEYYNKVTSDINSCTALMSDTLVALKGIKEEHSYIKEQLFSTIYIYIDYQNSIGKVSNIQMNEFTLKLLEIMKIDSAIVPWLMK